MLSLFIIIFNSSSFGNMCWIFKLAICKPFSLKENDSFISTSHLFCSKILSLDDWLSSDKEIILKHSHVILLQFSHNALRSSNLLLEQTYVGCEVCLSAYPYQVRTRLHCVVVWLSKPQISHLLHPRPLYLFAGRYPCVLELFPLRCVRTTNCLWGCLSFSTPYAVWVDLLTGPCDGSLIMMSLRFIAATSKLDPLGPKCMPSRLYKSRMVLPSPKTNDW